MIQKIVSFLAVKFTEGEKVLYVDYRFAKSSSVSDKLKKLMEMRIDIAIGGISIIEERERKIDFTHPYFHTGLGILVQKRSSLSLGKFFSF